MQVSVSFSLYSLDQWKHCKNLFPKSHYYRVKIFCKFVSTFLTGQNVSLASLDCHAHTTLCYQYHVTVLPALLLFTPDTLDTPSPPPPSVGVLDSTHILRALGQSLEESGDGLVSDDCQSARSHDCRWVLCLQIEATPASLPVLLRNKLTTPLILWCAEDQESSELASEFSEVALSNSMDLSFAWINR